MRRAQFASAAPDAQSISAGSTTWPLYMANISSPLPTGADGKFMWLGKTTAKGPADYAGVEQSFADSECGFWRSIDEGVVHFQ